MCGIAGFIDPVLSSADQPALIADMLACISNRGPDGSDKWIDGPVVLGHNRLSILDLGNTGDQPMHFRNSVIVFNGEIYNYLELRKELQGFGYSFNSTGDTEVILAAYDHWGSQCVTHFSGMWAFALWDKKKNILFCSRDRFGIKPFNYIFENNRFYFASEYKSLKKSPLFSNDLNMDQVSRGLQLGWISYNSETYFKKIKALPEASNLIFDNGKIIIEKYWDINPALSFNGSAEEKQEKFRSLFTDSIKLHMRSDVEVGGCLSGGLDSSSIASAVSMLYPQTNFKTFTIYYDGNNEVDERPWANMVLEKFPSLSGFSFTPTENDVEESLDKVLFHSEVPMAGSSPISQYFVMKLAHKHGIKVLLDGQGSDEYLAGYMHSFYRLLGGQFSKLNILNGFRESYSHIKTQQFSFSKSADLIAKSLLTGITSEEKLYNIEYKKYFPFLMNGKSDSNIKLENVGGSRLNKFLYHLMFTTSLPSLLHYEDRNAMAFSIESRVPFLDHRLVEFAFSLPDSDKFTKGSTKDILRRSLRGIVPDPILNRRDKKGFVTPGEIKWLRGTLKHLLDINYKKLDFLSADKTKKVIDDFKAGDNKNANLVWRIAMLYRWLSNN